MPPRKFVKKPVEPKTPPRPEARKALDAKITALLEKSNKMWGPGSLMTLAGPHATIIAPPGVVSTGSIALDAATKIGGLPRGRIVEIYGPESGGKTTLALHVLAEAQKQNLVTAFVDAEHSLDPNYAEALGVHLDTLLLSQPDSGEQALDIVQTLVLNGADVIVIDSVAALVPQAEVEGDMSDLVPGGQARLMSQAMRKLTSHIHKSKALVVFINQIRHKIGMSYGNPETTSGGNALKFYSSMRIEVRIVAKIREGTTEDSAIVGNRVKAKIVKNKLAPPFKTAEFDLVFGRGIAWDTELLDLGTATGCIEKAGAWYSWKGDSSRMGQGRASATRWIREHEDIAKEIREWIKKSMLSSTPMSSPTPDAPSAEPSERSESSGDAE